VSLLTAALLGLVQGLTEFLPVSSSAHLLLFRAWLGWEGESLGLAFDVACHLGTLLAVMVYFWPDLLGMLKAAPRLFGPSREARLARLIVIGTIPVAIVGALFADFIETQTRAPWVTVFTLSLGAVGLLAAERWGRHEREVDGIEPAHAFTFGLAQASALIPGVSRSGITITTGMLLGFRREAAARFSFLLGVPAILAAGAKEGLELVERGGLSSGDTAIFITGFASSAIVGYLTIKYFLRFLVGHRLDGFSY
jgi:undecaprenyl-diphosphatase